MKNFKSRQVCLKAASRLRVTDIYLNEDVSKATMEIRKAKLQEISDKGRQGLSAYFSGTTLVIKPRKTQDSRVGDEATKESIDEECGSANQPGRSFPRNKRQDTNANRGHKLRSTTKK